MTKYQYCSIAIPAVASANGTDFDSVLNEYGGAGWELVAYGFQTGVGIFKRPAEPQPPALLVVNNVPGADFEQLADSLKAELDSWWKEPAP